MREAIAEAAEGIHAGHGGPFGSVIVRDGKIVGRGHNRVLINHDPTCHGEVAAIRDAGAQLKTHDLSGCELYTTGEPCPMCLCACMWANIEKVYYGCSLDENAEIGFRDEKLNHVMNSLRNDERFEPDQTHESQAGISGPAEHKDYLEQLDHEACKLLFDEYSKIQHTLY
ncbi:MAG: nucleoside deaminase [Eubacterium sp.]|nr:nucleoside deaminase [Eubacterium sp.]